MTAWLVVLAAAMGTYLFRASLLVGLAGRQLPQAVQSRIALAGPAAVATLVVSTVLARSDSVRWPELLAALAGFLAARRTGKVTHAFLIGLPVLWGVTAAGVG